tara:strand:- start:338 stop:712 length:375 start_codon:yes stop_codon:yes gene_type:complete
MPTKVVVSDEKDAEWANSMLPSSLEIFNVGQNEQEDRVILTSNLQKAMNKADTSGKMEALLNRALELGHLDSNFIADARKKSKSMAYERIGGKKRKSKKKGKKARKSLKKSRKSKRRNRRTRRH